MENLRKLVKHLHESDMALTTVEDVGPRVTSALTFNGIMGGITFLYSTWFTLHLT